MSTPWSAPDPRRSAATVPPPDGAPPSAGSGAPLPAGSGAPPPAGSGAPPGAGAWDVLPGRTRLPLGPDLRVAALTALGTLLAGAPVGLLWSVLAPRVDVVVTAGRVDLVEPNPSAFIAADGYFLAAVLLAGTIGGVAAWALARPRGPGAVVGVAVGGLAAAYVAMVVGQEVGYDEVRAAVDAGRDGPLSLSLRLRAREALAGWPVAALLGYVAAALRAGADADDDSDAGRAGAEPARASWG